MKRIMIIGFSGSGKSTLARDLGEKLGIEPTYLDSIWWKPNWVENTREDTREKLSVILEREEWIIDGLYRSILFGERLELADTLIYLDFNRFLCFARAVKRRIMYNNKSRPDMTEGCKEKLDFEFAKWVLYDGRKKRKKNLELINMLEDMDKKVYVFHRPRQVKRFLENIKQERIDI